MKQRSLQRQLTLWFSAALLLMAGLAFVLVFSVSHSVLQKLLRDELVHTVEDNLDEVEFSRTLQQLDIDGDADQYIRYGVGYLEIDDDFLDSVNGVYTALLREGGELLYGENPISGFEPKELVDGALRVIRVRGEKYYVFDRRLESPGGICGCAARWPNRAAMRRYRPSRASACGSWAQWRSLPSAAAPSLPGARFGRFAICQARQSTLAAAMT